jgi:hypothetical protein
MAEAKPPVGARKGEPVPAPPKRPRRVILSAALLVFVVARIVPFGSLVLYPFTLLATWVHEMGHGLTALALGGRFRELEIFANASGLAYTQVPVGPKDALVCLGGLLAPPLWGALILGLCHGPKRARVLFAVLSGLITLSVAIWVRSAPSQARRTNVCDAVSSGACPRRSGTRSSRPSSR